MALTGLVVQNTGSFYLVQAEEQQLYNCKLKGSFKLNGIRTTNPVAVGDWVDFELPEGEGEEQIAWITHIHPRRNYIIRRSSNLSKQSHIIGANLDRSLLLVTINYPVTSTTFIDRYLATAEAYRVETALVFNKIDRYREREQIMLRELLNTYEQLGYRCFVVSAKEQIGLEELKGYISEGITLVSGHSGVGKSTFINALVPDAQLRTQAISEQNNTGVHTTTFSEMIPFGEQKGSYLIDTPGIKGFGTIEFQREEVGHYFREIFALLTRHHRTAEWKEKVGQHDHWKTFIWYWDMLACEYDNQAEGIPYMDIVENIVEKEKTGKVLLQFANRQSDTEKLRKTLKRIGCEDKVLEEDGYVILEEIASVKADDVAERVNYWIERISH